VTHGLTVAEDLSSAEPEVRRLAARALSTLDANTAALLLARALGDSDWRVRKEAVGSAQAMKPRNAVLSVLEGLLDRKDDIGLRNAAVLALRALGEDAVAVAARAYAALDADGRKLAVEVLVGARDHAALAVLERSLSDPDENVRIAGVEAMASMVERAVEARSLLTAMLAGELPTELRLACLRSLHFLGASLPLSVVVESLEEPLLRPAAVRLLRHVTEKRATLLCAMALADSRRSVVCEALVALSHRMSSADADELEIVSRTLAPQATVLSSLRAILASDEDPEVRAGALLALSLARAPEDAQLFVDALADDQIAEAAERSLRFYGQSDGSALLSATKTAGPMARGAAISMVPLVSRDGDAVLLLRDALSAPEPDVVVAALRGIGELGQAQDLERVSVLASSQGASVSVAASHAVAALAEQYPEAALKAWATASLQEDVTLAGCVLAACAPLPADDSSGAERRVAYLVRATGHTEPRVRAAAIEGLGGFPGNQDAQDAVTFAVADEEPSAALAAVRSLAALGQVATLTQVLARSRDASLTGAAFDALRRVSEGQAEIARRLLSERLQKETDETMRAAILFTLARAESDG
jgi:HEAT repeat protein